VFRAGLFDAEWFGFNIPPPLEAPLRGPVVLSVPLASRAMSTDNVAVRNSEADLERMSLSRLLAVAGHVVAIRWQRLMGSYGLTPHGLTVLGCLEEGSTPTQRDLARRCGVAPSTLNHPVDHLERSGWIERRRDDSDRRLVRLALTETGQRQLEQVRKAASGQMEPMLDHLAPSDELAVRRFLLDTVERFQALDEDSGDAFGYPG
jgi:DNA-binding MarR family transcriptional regulator